MRTAIALAALLALSGCFAAPKAVSDNSQLEAQVWDRYVARTQVAIAVRNDAIRKLGFVYSQKLLSNDLAKVSEFCDKDGKADAMKVKDWVLESVAMRDTRNEKILALIADLDKKIAEDQALIDAARGIHKKGQEWLDAGVDQSAVDGLLDTVVPLLKPEQLKGK
jgi:hypothetical protein